MAVDQLGEVEFLLRVDVVTLEVIDEDRSSRGSEAPLGRLEELACEHIQARLLDDDRDQILRARGRGTRRVVQRPTLEPSEPLDTKRCESRVCSAIENRREALFDRRSRDERRRRMQQHHDLCIDVAQKTPDEVLNLRIVTIELGRATDEPNWANEVVLDVTHNDVIACIDDDIIDHLDTRQGSQHVIDEGRPTKTENVLLRQPPAIQLRWYEAYDVHCDRGPEPFSMAREYAHTTAAEQPEGGPDDQG